MSKREGPLLIKLTKKTSLSFSENLKESKEDQEKLFYL